MKDDFRDIDRLNHLLEAEHNGLHFDHGEVSRLVARVAQSFPDVAGTLNLMLERHNEKRG